MNINSLAKYKLSILIVRILSIILLLTNTACLSEDRGVLQSTNLKSKEHSKMQNIQNNNPASNVVSLREYRDRTVSQRPQNVRPKDLELIECGNEECGWKGFRNQLNVLGHKDSPSYHCPKCDSDDLGKVVSTADSFTYKNTRRAGGRG